MNHTMMQPGTSRSAALALVATLLVWLMHNPAHACINFPATVDASYPYSGQTQVPTNVVLFAYGDGLNEPDLQLVTSDRTPVAIRVEAAEISGFDITPEEPLAPRTHYEL